MPARQSIGSLFGADASARKPKTRRNGQKHNVEEQKAYMRAKHRKGAGRRVCPNLKRCATKSGKTSAKYNALLAAARETIQERFPHVLDAHGEIDANALCLAAASARAQVYPLPPAVCDLVRAGRNIDLCSRLCTKCPRRASLALWRDLRKMLCPVADHRQLAMMQRAWQVNQERARLGAGPKPVGSTKNRLPIWGGRFIVDELLLAMADGQWRLSADIGKALLTRHPQNSAKSKVIRDTLKYLATLEGGMERMPAPSPGHSGGRHPYLYRITENGVRRLIEEGHADALRERLDMGDEWLRTEAPLPKSQSP